MKYYGGSLILFIAFYEGICEVRANEAVSASLIANCAEIQCYYFLNGQ